jgi:hypothetical protein
MKKLVYGVGINDADCVVNPTINGKPQWCFYYRTWYSMMQRCYSSKFQSSRQSYIGCTVCKEWHSFMAFRAWMVGQDWQGKALDKDILVTGNKIYSPDTCLFVSLQINSLLTDGGASRGKWPVGVCWHGRGRNFQAYCRINGKQKHLGSFTDPHAAHRAWQQCKIKVFCKNAAGQDNTRLIAALNRIAAKIQSDFDSNTETTNYGV